MKVGGKNYLTSKIHSRLGGAVPKDEIANAIEIICEEISTKLQANQSISVKNFGTLSPYVSHDRTGYDFDTGGIKEVKGSSGVKFHTHESFAALIKHKRGKFLLKRVKS